MHNETLIERAIRNPALIYGSPVGVLDDERLTNIEKDLVLQSWALDQKRLMASDNENMTAPIPSKRKLPASEMLRVIQAAQRRLNT